MFNRLLAWGVAVNLEELQGTKGERDTKEKGKEREKGEGERKREKKRIWKEKEKNKVGEKEEIKETGEKEETKEKVKEKRREECNEAGKIMKESRGEYDSCSNKEDSGEAECDSGDGDNDQRQVERDNKIQRGERVMYILLPIPTERRK